MNFEELSQPLDNFEWNFFHMQANSTKKYTEIPHFCKELEEMLCSNRILRYSYANSEKCMLSYNGALEQSILF